MPWLRALLVLALVGLTGPARAEEWLYVKAAPSVIARAGPGLELPVVTAIPFRSRVRYLASQSQVVEVAGEAGRFTQVEWEGKRGWVLDRFLSLVAPLSAPEARRQLTRRPVRCGPARLTLREGGGGAGRFEPAWAAGTGPSARPPETVVRNVRWWGEAPFYVGYEEWSERRGTVSQVGFVLCELSHDEALGRFSAAEVRLDRAAGPFELLGLEGPDRLPVHAAAARGDLGALAASAHALDVRCRFGWTALHHASWQGQAEAVGWLLARGVGLGRANDGCTALHVAAAAGREAVVGLLLPLKPDLAEADRAGRTPLHWAAERGRLGVAQRLLAAGAPVDARDARGRTPLFWAAQRGRDGLVRALLGAGAGANSRDADDASPLHAAAGGCSPEAVEALLGAGADPAAVDRYGLTPVEHAYLARCERVPEGLAPAAR